MLTQTLMTTNADNAVMLKTVFGVEPQYVQQAINLAHDFNAAINPQTLQLDFNQVQQIIRDKGIPNSKQTSQSFTMDNANAGQLADRVCQFINQSFSVQVPPDFQQQMYAQINDTFQHLYTEHTDAWIFYEKNDAHSTSFRSNLLFGIQQGTDLILLLIGLTIIVQVEYERILFITIHDTHEYTVASQAVEVSVPLQG